MRFLKVRYTVFLFGGRRWVKVKIVIWGCGYLSRLFEDYIRQDVEVVAYVDNNEKYWGGYLEWSMQGADYKSENTEKYFF